jgi:RNA polymerase sigma factor (sigma-70 family)
MENPDDSLATRASLLERLRDWDDQAGWREFFDRYWRLIYNVARKAGLQNAEAQDIVQETLLSVARKLPGFRYDPSLGSFKGWLLLIVRSRITDFRRRRTVRPPLDATPENGDGRDTAFIERLPAEDAAGMEAVWQEEWERNLLEGALAKVKATVAARQFLVFQMTTAQGLPVSTVARTLGINAAQVYLARHRVARAIRNEVDRLRRLQEKGP